ncbi:histidine phosphatase family protein [Plebeiibacterium sediminum]|uniref:Histidine phosphatase family protein n=1 Tax=Plebeiibacterium sediminum TaxID=2992112 RepID=A0AAE3M283_9BACT|nr:histidine phosphatase family protein [Plebeiobacterium sediminum]MCW3785465.1 histidine phosphatase family protein [Plebeiobacterium sediminum]
MVVLQACSPNNYKATHSSVYKHDSLVKQCEYFTCIQDIDSTLQEELKKQNKRLIQIYLIRHAKPDIQKKKFYSRKQAEKYLYDYNHVPIQKFDTGLIKVNLDKDHTVYCSALRRSIETAHTIFKDNYPIISDSIFNEFENKIIKSPGFIRQPLLCWQILSRGTWALGRKPSGIESHKKAKERASYAASKLIDIANKEETAILVAHGMLNRAITKNLKLIGWKTIQSNGQKNLGATILIKIVDIN